ncbi:hypothetical protein [Streptomyces albidoflavus]|uniref:hypothetical protein n=1 Tax=Streptomyces albidoflavus TaxID=1886 RepID=UPI000B16B514|nr:hypothetical protein [Streptomyces albidoflavus]MCR0988462.1 hypothetical protein [Streptomyces albidoflavus]
MSERTLPYTPGEQAVPAGRPIGEPPRERRLLRAVARWSLIVAVAGGIGIGTHLFVTAQDRTDLPGLATRSDGRWDFPTQRLPALPADAMRPAHPRNPAGIHHADLRDLLVTAPAAPSRTRS